MQFAQRSLRLGFAGVAAPARKRPLRGVRTQGFRAPGQQKRRSVAGLGFRQRNRYRGPLQRRLRLAAEGGPRERRAELCDFPPRGIVK